MTVYNPNVPQPGDDPTASQADLLGNFGKINTDWAVNHVALTSGGNNGLHKFIQFPTVLSVDPAVTGTQSCVYPKTGFDSNPALFFKNAVKTFQLTNLTVTNSFNDYGITSPWGIIFNFGSINSGTLTATFAVPFVNSTIYTAILTPYSNSVGYRVVSVTNTKLTIATSSNSGFYYFVMGK